MQINAIPLCAGEKKKKETSIRQEKPVSPWRCGAVVTDQDSYCFAYLAAIREIDIYGKRRLGTTWPSNHLTSEVKMTPCFLCLECSITNRRSWEGQEPTVKDSRLKHDALWCAVTLLIAVLLGKWGTKSTFTICLHKYLMMSFLLLVGSLFIHCWNVPAGYKAHLLVHVVTWRGSIFLIWCGINFSTGSAAFSTAVLWDIHPHRSRSAGDFGHVSPLYVRQNVRGVGVAVVQAGGWADMRARRLG